MKMNDKDYSRPLDLKQVQITDAFWGREQELVRTQVIPYQWEALNDRIPEAAPSFCMRNFKVAGELMREKQEQGNSYVPPTYTYRGFEALPEDSANPDPGKFYGFVFQDSDFFKWVEAVGYSLAGHPDPELERTADEAIDIVCGAQAENGYLDTYYIINGMDRIFTNLRSHHELYCFGHLVEGAVAYYQATGKDKLLMAAERYGDFIADHFGPETGKCQGYPGHEIAEMALARLYEVTGKQKYLELSRFFLDMRGTRPYYFDREEKEQAEYEGKPYKAPGEELRFQYNQAHLPVREQAEAVGHAVRAVYLYSGMADVARLTQDEAMYGACRKLWDSIANEKLYITGGIGGTHIGEAFSYPYDLPNDTAYSETCAAIGLAFFARRMLEIRADGRYGDVMEQALYNTIPAGMALDGKSFFYVNPLEVMPEACEQDERKRHVKNMRQKWFGCACCPPNIARIVSSLGAYAYTGNESALFTHLYLGSRLSFVLGGHSMSMDVETDYPWDGEVKITLHAGGEAGAKGTLAFRIPGWCRGAQAEVRRKQCTLTQWDILGGGIVSVSRQLSLEGMDWDNAPAKVDRLPVSGENIEGKIQDGYLYMDGEWQDGDEIYLTFPMEVRCVRANTRVREDIGKVAFLRGPVCYCMEEADNGKDLHLLRVDPGKLADAKVECSRELGHEMRVLRIPGYRQEPSGESDGLYTAFSPAEEREAILTWIPYYAWNNRGKGEMSVWVRY